MTWLLLLSAAWVAGTISGVAGFGGALLLLPLLNSVVGPKAAVPILTIAQFFGNTSRAAFGWRQIGWRPILLFSAGSLPASILGAWLFVASPSIYINKGIGIVLLLIVVIRHTTLGQKTIPEYQLPVLGFAVGLISAIAGSAGPLAATVFLGLQLPSTAYVATEAVSATIMHVTKIAIYGRYALVGSIELWTGLSMGFAMILGSWTGKKLIEKLSVKRFQLLVEFLLVVSAIYLLLS